MITHGLKFIAPLILIFSSSAIYAGCNSKNDKLSIARKFYGDTDVRRFVYSQEKCTFAYFYSRILFKIEEGKHGKSKYCTLLIEPVEKFTNHYTGVFVKNKNRTTLQFISFGRGVYFRDQLNGMPTLIEEGWYDQTSPIKAERNTYHWTGSFFDTVK